MYVYVYITHTHTHTQSRVLLIHDDELAAHFSSPFIFWQAHAPPSSPHEEMMYDVIKATHSQGSTTW
jgi:hypothetical protein